MVSAAVWWCQASWSWSPIFRVYVHTCIRVQTAQQDGSHQWPPPWRSPLVAACCRPWPWHCSLHYLHVVIVAWKKQEAAKGARNFWNVCTWIVTAARSCFALFRLPFSHLLPPFYVPLLCRSSLHCVELPFLLLNVDPLLFSLSSESVSSRHRNRAIFPPSDAWRLANPSIVCLFVSVLCHYNAITFPIELLYSCFTLLRQRTDNQSVERAPRWDDEIVDAGGNGDNDSWLVNSSTAMMDTGF